MPDPDACCEGSDMLLCDFFVGLPFVAPPLLALILRTSTVLRTIRGPSHDVSLVRRGLRNRWGVTGVGHAL